jgi:oligopeptide transport system substrate-binding protein
VLRGAVNRIYYLSFNNRDGLLRDPMLRRAISLALNRKAACETALGGVCIPADSIVPPGVAGYQENGWADARFDLAAAKAALVEARHANGKGLPTIVLSYEAGLVGFETAQSVQADLKAVGVNSVLESVDRADYQPRLESGKYQVGLVTWSADYQMMDATLSPLFNGGSKDNVSGYSDDAFDRGVEVGRATLPENVRTARYLELNYGVQQTNPITPFAFYTHHHVSSSRVHNLIFSAQDLSDFCSVWITETDSK